MTDHAHDLLSRRICPRCHYDLAGLPDGHACPECGTEPDPAQIAVAGWAGRERPTRRGLVINLIVMAATAYAVVDGFANGRTTKDYVFAGAMALVFVTTVSYMIVYVRRTIVAAEGRAEGTLLIDGAEVHIVEKAGANRQGPLEFLSGHHRSGGARLTFSLTTGKPVRRLASFYVEGSRPQVQAIIDRLKAM